MVISINPVLPIEITPSKPSMERAGNGRTARLGGRWHPGRRGRAGAGRLHLRVPGGARDVEGLGATEWRKKNGVVYLTKKFGGFNIM